MAANLVTPILYGAASGIIAYAFCQTFDLPERFEKAVFTTIMIGMQAFAFAAIKSSSLDETQQYVFAATCWMLAIPCTILVCRLFKLNMTDPIHYVGIAYIAWHIVQFGTSIETLVLPQEAPHGNT